MDCTVVPRAKVNCRPWGQVIPITSISFGILVHTCTPDRDTLENLFKHCQINMETQTINVINFQIHSFKNLHCLGPITFLTLIFMEVYNKTND